MITKNTKCWIMCKVCQFTLTGCGVCKCASVLCILRVDCSVHFVGSLNCAMTDLIKLVTVVMLLFCTVLHLSNLCSENTLNRLMIATTLPLQTSFWITLLVFTRGEACFLQASLLWCSFDSAPSTAPLRWHFYNLRYNVFVFSFARASHHFYIHSLSQICIFSSIKCENGGRPFYEFLSHAHWL